MTIRILHILNELNPSGAEAMLQAASPYWQSLGINSEIVSTGVDVGPYAQALEEVGYHIHHIPFAPSFRFLYQIFKLLRREQYDVLHIYPERANFWYALTAYFAGVPRIVRTILNVFPFHGILRVRRYLQRWAMRRLLRVAMVSISTSVKQTEWHFFHNPTVLIASWYDSNRIRPPQPEERQRVRRQLCIPEGTLVVVSIGGCWPYKNHSALIEAIAILPRSSPILYLHAGREEPGYPERKLAESMGVYDRVRFLGIVPDILPILHAADIYAMPSLYEGFGVAAVEAMGAGLPVMLSDVPGLKDFREKCEDILWVEPKAQSIAATLLRFADLSILRRKEIGLALHRCALEWFGVDQGTRAYAALYRGQNLEAVSRVR